MSAPPQPKPKRPAEAPPEDEPPSARPAVAPLPAHGAVIWAHPTEDAELVEFDLTEHAELINAALESAKEELICHPKCTIYGKECRMRRSVGFFADPAHTYGYFFSRQLFASRMPAAPMQELIAVVRSIVGNDVNGVLVNYYADGEEYISAHSDDERGVGDAGVFAISVGAERRFVIAYNDKTVQEPKFEVATKSMFGILMAGKEFQRMMNHQIPPQKATKQPRWSLTFRRHDRHEEEDMYRRHVARGGIIN